MRSSNSRFLSNAAIFHFHDYGKKKLLFRKNNFISFVGSYKCTTIWQYVWVYTPLKTSMECPKWWLWKRWLLWRGPFLVSMLNLWGVNFCKLVFTWRFGVCIPAPENVMSSWWWLGRGTQSAISSLQRHLSGWILKFKSYDNGANLLPSHYSQDL